MRGYSQQELTANFTCNNFAVVVKRLIALEEHLTTTPHVILHAHYVYVVILTLETVGVSKVVVRVAHDCCPDRTTEDSLPCRCYSWML